MKNILIFAPKFSLQERKEIVNLNNEIWDKVADVLDPILEDELGITCYMSHSLKIQKQNNLVTVMDTSNNPYSPIYNRYLLRLILDNILEE